MVLCIKCRPNMTESEMVTSKFVLHIKFPKFWYIALLVTKLSAIFQDSGAISWTRTRPTETLSRPQNSI